MTESKNTYAIMSDTGLQYLGSHKTAADAVLAHLSDDIGVRSLDEESIAGWSWEVHVVTQEQAAALTEWHEVGGAATRDMPDIDGAETITLEALKQQGMGIGTDESPNAMTM